MSASTIIYLSQLSEGMSVAFILISIAIGFYLVISKLIESEASKKWVAAAIVLLIVGSALPSQKTVLMMYVASDDRVGDITNTALDVIEQKLEKLKND